MKDKTR
jgi:predicted house-cleaning noncanonical NTP pyrophosphatase (MazG superfamily)